MLWRCQTTVMQKTTLTIHNVSITIEHGRQLCLVDLSDNTAHSVSSRQEVTSIQETDIITIETTQSLVHRIIDTLIRLRNHLDTMPVLCGVRPFDIRIHHLEGRIRRSTVDDQMHNLRIILTKHTVKRPLKHVSGIIGNRHIGHPYHRR